MHTFLRPDDVLVLNDTKVFPARLLGKKESGGRVEMLLVKQTGDDRWTCLLKASKSPKTGTVLAFKNGLTAKVLGRSDDMYTVCLSDPDRLPMSAQVPLPPYIERDPEAEDEALYQTVYARNKGSVAAPTAGLHFTERYLNRIRNMGVRVVSLTLHVGPGTFVPVRVKNIQEHRMHPEDFHVSPDTAEVINDAMAGNRRIVAVGTTTTRVLEHLMKANGRITTGSGSSALFIYEGYPFACVGALLTNFHLPCSTLLMLVAAFGGHDHIMKAYEAAIKERYRFFSYGDAMFIF